MITLVSAAMNENIITVAVVPYNVIIRDSDGIVLILKRIKNITKI